MADKTERILTLLGPLSDGSFPSVETLSRKFGVSRRTFFRDVKLLRKAGLTVRFDKPRRGYSLVSEYSAPRMPTPDDLAELLRLVFASNLPQSSTQRKRAQRAADILASGLPDATRKELEWFDIVVQSVHENCGMTRDAIDQILEGCYSKRLVEVDFDSGASNFPRPCRVLPQRLRHDGGRWLLEGVLVASHRSLRVALDRVSEVQVLEHPKPPRFSKKVLDWSQADIEIT